MSARESRLVGSLRAEIDALPVNHELRPLLEQLVHVISRQDFFMRQLQSKTHRLEDAVYEDEEE